VTRGEPRIRPTLETPVPVLPAYASLPDRDISKAAPRFDGRTVFTVGQPKFVTKTCTGLWTEQGRVLESGGRGLRIECVSLCAR